jgi:ribosomal protein L34E
MSKCLICDSELHTITHIKMRPGEMQKAPENQIHTSLYQCIHALSERIKQLEGGR